VKADFMAVVTALEKQFPDLRGKRLGFRYINRIEIPDASPLQWEEYIDAQLLGLFQKFGRVDELLRLFHVIELKRNDVIVKFQFGVYNPDFPALIKRPQFIIDQDARYSGLIDWQNITGYLDQAHEAARSLFEDSITDKLRERMNA
jgi:uncharacterized protein (TIGR04255 family)